MREADPNHPSNWRKYYNNLFMRRLPASITQVRLSAEALAVEELDCAEAYQRGIDKMPQFLEDRRNFWYASALDAFEKEQIRPSEVIDESSISSYFSEHLTDFVRVPTVSGMILCFKSEASALAWLRTHSMAPQRANDHIVPGLAEEITYSISIFHPFPGMEKYTDVVLSSRDSDPVGPIRVDSDWVIFAKDGPMKMEYPPLEAVTPAVRIRLANRAREKAEIQLASTFCKRFRIIDEIPYGKYGITNEAAPWSD